MKKRNDGGAGAPELAAARLAEIDALSRHIRKNLSDMLAEVDGGHSPNLKELQNKLNELHAAHLKVLAAEDAFHARLGKTTDENAVDFDAVRTEIGRRLDRLRESRAAGGFSGDADT